MVSLTFGFEQSSMGEEPPEDVIERSELQHFNYIISNAITT
jgi:hypothetical protein